MQSKKHIEEKLTKKTSRWKATSTQTQHIIEEEEEEEMLVQPKTKIKHHIFLVAIVFVFKTVPQSLQFTTRS